MADKVEVVHNGKKGTLIFRENWATGRVEAKISEAVVLSSPEYRTTAEQAQQKFNLSDAQLAVLYSGYREDFYS